LKSTDPEVIFERLYSTPTNVNCDRCNGSGRKSKRKCYKCDGTGKILKARKKMRKNKKIKEKYPEVVFENLESKFKIGDSVRIKSTENFYDWYHNNTMKIIDIEERENKTDLLFVDFDDVENIWDNNKIDSEYVYLCESDPEVIIENFTTFINEEKTYKEGDTVLIRYWVTGDVIPVKIKEVKAKNAYLVTFNVQNSLYDRAPDKIIKKSDIIGLRKPDAGPINPGDENTVKVKGDADRISNDIVIMTYNQNSL
jgi:ribosomal protein L21E